MTAATIKSLNTFSLAMKPRNYNSIRNPRATGLSIVILAVNITLPKQRAICLNRNLAI